MNKLKVFYGIGFLFLLISLVSAGTWIYSNVITVTVNEYSFKKSLVVDNANPLLNENITFSGTLYYNNVHVDSGYNITLFRDNTPIAWTLTDSSGSFSIVYNATQSGFFYVGYWIP